MSVDVIKLISSSLPNVTQQKENIPLVDANSRAHRSAKAVLKESSSSLFEVISVRTDHNYSVMGSGDSYSRSATVSDTSDGSFSEVVEIDLNGTYYTCGQLDLLLKPNEHGRSYIHELVDSSLSSSLSADLLNLYLTMKNVYTKEEISQFFCKRDSAGRSPLAIALSNNNSIIASELICYGAKK